MLQSQPDIIETVDETVLAERIDLEISELIALRILDLLVRQVDLDLAACAGLGCNLGQRGLVGDGDGQHAVFEGVVEEDVSEGGGNDAFDAKVEEGPGGVFTGATAAKVGACHDQDGSVAVDALVEDKVRVFLAVGVAEFEEGGAAQARALDGLEELLGDNGVGVDVGAVERRSDTLKDMELGEAGAGGCTAVGGIGVGFVVGGHVHYPVEFLIRLRFLDVLNVHLGLCLALDRTDRDVLANIGQLANNGSGGSHGRGHQVGAATSSLTAFEVAVGGTGAAFLRGENVRVHTQTHGASRLSPLETSICENLVETLGFRLLLNETGSGDNHCALDVGGNLFASNHPGRCPQVFNTSVGARTNKNFVQLNILHGRAGHKTHVLQSTRAGRFTALILKVTRTGDDSRDRNDVLRRGTPGDSRDDILAIDQDGLVVGSTLVGTQVGPVVDGLLPQGTVILWGQGATLEVFKSDLVGCDHACTRTAFNGHITHGHPSLHTQTPDHGATVFNDSTSTTGSTNETDNVKNDILAGDTGGKFAVDLDAHVLTPTSDKSLGGENVLDLTGTDTKGQRAKRAMRRGVTVTADDSRSGQSKPLLGADNVNNTLTLIPHAKVCEIKGLHVLLQGRALQTRVAFLDEFVDILEVFAGGGRDVL